MKQLGVAYLEIDDEVCIKFTFSNDYSLGDLERVCQIFKNLYYDDTSKNYFRRRT
jgi:hypothetical protein